MLGLEEKLGKNIVQSRCFEKKKGKEGKEYLKHLVLFGEMMEEVGKSNNFCYLIIW